MIVGNVPIVPLKLIDERYYHGDTVFCSFGSEKEHLLVYLDALSKESQHICRREFGDSLVLLSKDDAEIYAANSFQTIYENNIYLFLPKGVSQNLIDEVKERGANPVLVNVSEFLKKGGGSIKCMVCDLGIVVESPNLLSKKVENYRDYHRYENYYTEGILK